MLGLLYRSAQGFKTWPKLDVKKRDLKMKLFDKILRTQTVLARKNLWDEELRSELALMCPTPVHIELHQIPRGVTHPSGVQYSIVFRKELDQKEP